MKENVVKSFIRDTYKTTSIIPYIITGQIVVFILLHIFDLLTFSQTTSVDLYNIAYSKSVLPIRFEDFIAQPWSIVTHPFLYTSIWNLLFDCIWLYWTGNLFLTYLNTRQFNTIFLGALGLGAILYLALGFIPYFHAKPTIWHTTSFGLAAIISALMILVPNSEIRLLLLGNIKFKWVAAIYLGFGFASQVGSNSAAALVYSLVVFAGMLFIRQLQQGKDWSRIFQKKKRTLRVVKTNYTHNYKKAEEEFPDQQKIDQILDKISLKGYESLTSQEKEILFRASKKQD